MSPRAMFWANVALAVLCLVAALLQVVGCAPPVPADHTAPDLGPCARLAATLADGGPVAHVVVYPNGHPCEGGTCQQGECVP